MFWRVSGLQTCPVDTILDKDEYTLEELLDEDELVQETKSLNPRLIDFLKKKENVRALVRYMVVEVGDGDGEATVCGVDQICQEGEDGRGAAQVDSRVGVEAENGKKEDEDQVSRSSVDSRDSDVEDKARAFKYPFTACEIFCCEVEAMYNTLLENEDILALFFSILNKKVRPLNTILAGYFSRVMGALLARRSSDIVMYLQSNPEILNKLVYHVDTTSVAEVLARLAGADDPVGYSESPSVTWLADTDVLQLLVKSLRNDTPSEGQANASEVLAAIARSTATRLTKSMANELFMQELVDAALSEHSGTAASHALNVCLALLEPLTVDPTMGRFPVVDIHDVLRQEAVRCLSQKDTLERLVELLGVTGNMPNGTSTIAMSTLPTTYGRIEPPVGQLRLKIVDLLASLFRTTDPTAEQAIMNTKAVKKAMEMFLEYPFNNALHGGVTMLLTAFEEGSEALRRYLMEEAKLVEWLVGAPRTLNNVSAEEKTLVSLRKENTELRAGYCGHLTQIANRLQRCTETCDYLKSFLDKSEIWKEYKEKELDARNRVESVMAWKCGRPVSQSVGLHGMYSGGYSDLGHGDDDIGDDFDSDHNRFAAVEVGGPGDHGDGDVDSNDEGSAVTTIEDEEIANTGIPTIGTAKSNTGVGDCANNCNGTAACVTKMSPGASGELSMDDMEDDEVCFDMDDDDDDVRQRNEADATDGLLELGESLTRLAVFDGEASNGGDSRWA